MAIKIARFDGLATRMEEKSIRRRKEETPVRLAHE